MTALAGRTVGDGRRFCPHCAHGQHRNCSGTAAAMGGTCECADRRHDPDVETAAAMRLFQAPDLAAELRAGRTSIETLATQYRRVIGSAP